MLEGWGDAGVIELTSRLPSRENKMPFFAPVRNIRSSGPPQ